MDTPDTLEHWLRVLVSRGAADMFLVSGFAPAIRLNGVVTPLPEPSVAGEDIEAAVLPILHPQALERYRTAGSADISLRRAGVGRFRINLHRERGRAAATIRALPASPPLLADLGLPSQVEQITRLHHGLVLVGGATGSGKTTTVAALVNEINRRDAKHIVTIEDPIEYEHAHQKSVVEQVEIGVDAPDFPTALRAALRQAPDVIVIGEMRDPETMKIALTAGETGHLVFSTLHTTDVTSTVARVADSFPPERQPTIRQDLSMALGAVLTQALLPRVGGGRVPAAELLMIGYGARQHIRKNALQHLHQEITITKRSGSITFEEALAHLVHNGLITADDARTHTGHAEELEGLLRPSSIVDRRSST
jgi:twitching motility protein PilT